MQQQSIVQCRVCRMYFNPFIIDSHPWRYNLGFGHNSNNLHLCQECAQFRIGLQEMNINHVGP